MEANFRASVGVMGRTDPKAIGGHLKQIRERAHLTQAQLAEAAGVSDETISRLERGAYEPSFTTVVAIADALGMRVDVLIGDAQSAPHPRVEPVLVQRLAAIASLLPTDAQRALVRVAEFMREGGRPTSGKRNR